MKKIIAGLLLAFALLVAAPLAYATMPSTKAPGDNLTGEVDNYSGGEVPLKGGQYVEHEDDPESVNVTFYVLGMETDYLCIYDEETKEYVGPWQGTSPKWRVRVAYLRGVNDEGQPIWIVVGWVEDEDGNVDHGSRAPVAPTPGPPPQ